MEILSLGEKLKRRRKELNMTLKDLAGDRITPGQISLVESGKSNPSMDLLEYLSSTLNTSIEYLMESEETQAEKICTYFENMAEAYILSDNLPFAEKYIEKALKYAEKYDLEYKKGKELYLRGIIYMKSCEYSLAQQIFLSANMTFIKLNCFEDIINTFLKLGIITLNLKAYNSAYSYFKQAEKVFLYNDIGNDFLIGEIYYYIAFTCNKLEETDKTIEYSNLAKEKFRQMDEKKEYAASLLASSKEYSDKEDINSAIKYSKKALILLKDINHSSYLSEIENNMGKIFYEFEDYKESFIHLSKSKEIRERNNDAKVLETMISICENYIKLKDIENSRKVLEEINANIGQDNESLMPDYYVLKYRIEILEGSWKEAEQTLLSSLEFVDKIGCEKKKADILIILSKFYIDKGQSEKATVFLTKGVEIFKSLGIFKNFE